MGASEVLSIDFSVESWSSSSLGSVVVSIALYAEMCRVQSYVRLRSLSSEEGTQRGDGSWEQRDVLRSRTEASDLARAQVTLPIGFIPVRYSSIAILSVVAIEAYKGRDGRYLNEMYV